MTLANAPWGSQPQMAHVGELRVRIRVIPLLMREVDIKRIRLIDTQLLLETDADGQANWQFNQTAGSRTGVGIRSAAVRHLQVEQLAVTVRKAETGAPAFLFNTQLAILKGDGQINLATERLDFVLSPKPKDSSLFTAHDGDQQPRPVQNSSADLDTLSLVC